MKQLKLYLHDVKKNVLHNWHTAFRNSKSWILFLSSLILSIVIYLHFDWSRSRMRVIGITEMAILIVNLFVLCSFYRTNTFISYLYFLFIFKFVHICLVLVGNDIYNFGKVHHVKPITDSVISILSLVAVMMVVGFSFANGLLLPLVLVLLIANSIEARICVRMKTKKSRVTFYVLWNMFFVIFLMFILSYIQFIEEDSLYQVFLNLLIEAGVKETAIKLFASPLYYLLSKGLFIIWFTVLLKANSLRGTDMFLRNSWALGMASSILFIGYQMQFFFNHQHAGDIIAVPAFVLIVTSLFLIRSIYYFVRSAKWNAHKAGTKDKYIPYVFSNTKKLNLIVQGYYYHQDKKQQTIEMEKIGKK